MRDFVKLMFALAGLNVIVNTARADDTSPTAFLTYPPATPSPAATRRRPPTPDLSDLFVYSNRATPRPTPRPTRMTMRPTPIPTQRPARLTMRPTRIPTPQPTRQPTLTPTPRPTRMTMRPTPIPTQRPAMMTMRPTPQPTMMPTPRPTQTQMLTADLTEVFIIPYGDDITYKPGVLNHNQAGLRLSRGLQARIIARSGRPVTYKNGRVSTIPFHGRPDAGACVPDTRPNNPGGWIYVSNSEMRLQDTNGTKGLGGVGALTIDRDGQVISYDMVLTNTTWNCGGGLTPWGTWVSCEEQPGGKVYQVDPFGKRAGQIMTMGREGGAWESFTYDIRNQSEPHFYLTEDAPRGAIQRFTPDKVTWNNDPWQMLHRPGKTEYLRLIPNVSKTGGRYRWVTKRIQARNNAFRLYPNVEGIDCDGDYIYFVSKKLQQLYVLNLRDGSYTSSSTVRGKFDGKPDQIARILASGNRPKHKDDLLYFTEEGGKRAGVHGRNPGGKYVTIFESNAYKSECAGLAFSPDGMKMYIAYQDQGILLEVSRQDGNPFHAKTLAIKYHKNFNNNGAVGGSNVGSGGKKEYPEKYYFYP